MALRSSSCETEAYITLVEDHPLAKRHLESLLSNEPGFRMTKTSSRQAEKGRAIPNIIILSHIHISTLAMYLKRVNRLNRSLRPLVIGAYPRPATLLSLLRSGVHGFVSDDDVDTDLLPAVRSLVQGRVWVRSRYLKFDSDGQRLPENAALQGASPFTPQQQKVVRLVTSGHSNKEIAADLGVSERTVKFHMQNILALLGVNSRHAIREALPPAVRPASTA